MAAPLGRPGDHRQHRRGPLQRLDLRLLIDREDRRVRRRRQVQAHHVADLVDQQRVRGDLEVLRAPGLQPEGPPDAVHAGRRDPHPPGQLPLGPVRGALRDLFQGPHHHLLHLGIGDGARHPRTRLVTQPVQPPGQEPRPPLGHRAAVDAQPRGDGRCCCRPRAQASTIRARKARPCAVLRRLAQFSRSAPLVLRQHQRLQPGIWHTLQHTARPAPCHHRRAI